MFLADSKPIVLTPVTNAFPRWSSTSPIWHIDAVSGRHSRGRKTTNFAGSRWGFIAPLVIDRPINCFSFETYVDKVPLPKLRAGNVVVMEISPATKNSGFAK